MTSAAGTPAADEHVRYRTARGRWVILAAVLGSGIAFLDSTVVNVALPGIGDDLGGGLSGLQWTLDGYLLTLSSLLLLGGALRDHRSTGTQARSAHMRSWCSTHRTPV